jgi:hypothetical protein
VRPFSVRIAATAASLLMALAPGWAIANSNSGGHSAGSGHSSAGHSGAWAGHGGGFSGGRGAWAGRPGGWGGGWHRHGSIWWGGGWGVGWGWGPYWDPWLWGWDYPYYAPSYPSYVAPDAGADPSAPPPPAYWYYCPAAKAYYPYVRQCPEPWVPVAPRPSG